MTKLPVATAYGDHDIIEMQPMPAPDRVTKYSTADAVEHTVGDTTNAVFIYIDPASAGSVLMLYGGHEADAEEESSVPISAALHPLAVTPGSTFTLTPVGDSEVTFRIQEVTF